MIVKGLMTTLDPNREMFNLSRVSSGWRRVIFETTEVWKLAKFVPPVNQDETNRAFLHTEWVLRYIPERFKNNMLDIAIVDSKDNEFRSKDYGTIMWILLRTRAQQLDIWQSLTIDVHEDSAMYYFSDHLTMQALCATQRLENPGFVKKYTFATEPSNLRVLELSTSGEIDYRTPNSKFFSGCTLPKLEVLIVRTSKVDWSVIADQVRGGVLQDLYLEGLDLEQGEDRNHFADIVSNSSLLHTLALISTKIVTDDKEYAPLFPTGLKTLTVTWSGYHDGRLLSVGALSLIRPPNLRSLTVGCFVRDRELEMRNGRSIDLLVAFAKPALEHWTCYDSISDLQLLYCGPMPWVTDYEAKMENQVNFFRYMPVANSKNSSFCRWERKSVQRLIPYARTEVTEVKHIREDGERTHVIVC